MVEGGLGAAAGGLAVAAGNLMLLNNLFARRWARATRSAGCSAPLSSPATLMLAAGLLSLRPPPLAGGAWSPAPSSWRSSTASARSPSCAPSARTSGRR